MRYFAAARAATGVSAEELPAASVAALVAVFGDRHGEPLARVLRCSSYLVDGLACRDKSAARRGSK